MMTITTKKCILQSSNYWSTITWNNLSFTIQFILYFLNCVNENHIDLTLDAHELCRQRMTTTPIFPVKRINLFCQKTRKKGMKSPIVMSWKIQHKI